MTPGLKLLPSHDSDDGKKIQKLHQGLLIQTGKRIEGIRMMSTLFSHEEIESLRKSMVEKYPLLATPTILKLLHEIGYSRVHQNQGICVYKLNEYEIVSTEAKSGPMKGQKVDVIIFPNLLSSWEDPKTGGMAQRIIQALNLLFPEEKISCSMEGVKSSFFIHGISPGYRTFSPHQNFYYKDSLLCGWLVDADGGTSTTSSFGWYNTDLLSGTNSYDRTAGFTLVPVFDS